MIKPRGFRHWKAKEKRFKNLWFSDRCAAFSTDFKVENIEFLDILEYTTIAETSKAILAIFPGLSIHMTNRWNRFRRIQSI